MKRIAFRSLISLGGLLSIIPFVAFGGLVTVGGSTPQTTTNSFLGSCDVTKNYSLYEGQKFRLYDTWVPDETNSSREILDATNVKVWNPTGVLGDSLTSNSLGGLLPTFTYTSNGKPGYTHFGITMDSVFTHKQNAYNYIISPSPATTRTSPLAQVVHYLSVRQVSLWGGAAYTMTYMDLNNVVGSATSTPSARWPTINDVQCQNFYIAKCGDGVRDNPSKPGNATTNGKNGILINGQILPRVSVLAPVPAEECDGTDGTPAGYTCNSSCKLVPVIVNPTCSLTPAQQSISCGGNAILHFNSTYTNSITNLVNISGGIIQSNHAGRFSVAPTQTTTYQFTVNGMAGSTPATCTAVVNVNPVAQPNCTLTPANQTINVGQNAILSFNSTYTNSITNLVNISGGIIQPNHAGRFSVTPTQTTTYQFTVNGGACTVPKVCTATVTVNPAPQPTCSLTPAQQSLMCGGSTSLQFNSSHATSISNLNNIPTGTIAVNTPGSFQVSPTQNTTYSFTVHGGVGTTPVTCTGVVVVGPAPQPTCSLTPAQQSITIGQSATLHFGSTYTTVISNLLNIGAGVIQPNQAGTFSVSPTQNTIYSFTAKGTGACFTTPSTCTGTVTVLPTVPPVLQISKTLLINKAYHSGDLVGFRIDFKNIGSGVAHNVILTDYLPASLQYVSSQLYGVTPPYVLWTGMFAGLHAEIIYSGFTLNPGQAGYMIITGQLLSYELCNQTTNAAYIESDEIQPPLPAAAVFMCYTPTTNLTIDKSIDKQLFYPGEFIHFTIAVTNNGPDVAQSVKIGDIRPNPSCILAVGSRSANMPMTLTNPNTPYSRTLNTTLPVGQTIYLYLTGQVNNTRSCAGNYLNTGTLTYTVNNQVRTGLDVVSFAVPLVNVTFNKSIVSAGTTHGDTVVFALDYANNGTDAVSSYDVTDYWPGTLTFLSATPMPQTQIAVPGGQILQWHFTTPLAPGGTGRIILNGRIN